MKEEITNILEMRSEEIAEKRAKWIESVLEKNISSWKKKLLIKFNKRWLRKLIRADFEIMDETLIANFGIKTIIVLNGKKIAERNY